MQLWEDMSGATKGYLVIAVLLIVFAIAYRSCSGPDKSTPPPPRGYVDGSE